MSNQGAVTTIFNWCQESLSQYEDVVIEDFTTSWRDGLAFLALIHKFRPDLVDYSKYSKDQPEINLKSAFDIAELELGIPRLLCVEDFLTDSPNLDKLSVFTYISQFYQCFKNSTPSGGPDIHAFIMKKFPKRFTNHKPTEHEPSSDMESPVLEDAPASVSLCHLCQQRVYLLEQFTSNGQLYHRSCFRASQLRHLDRRIHTLASTTKADMSKVEITEDISAYLQTQSQPGSAATSPTSSYPSSPTKSPQSAGEDINYRLDETKPRSTSHNSGSLPNDEHSTVIRAEVYSNGDKSDKIDNDMDQDTMETRAGVHREDGETKSTENKSETEPNVPPVSCDIVKDDSSQCDPSRTPDKLAISDDDHPDRDNLHSKDEHLTPNNSPHPDGDNLHSKDEQPTPNNSPHPDRDNLHSKDEQPTPNNSPHPDGDNLHSKDEQPAPNNSSQINGLDSSCKASLNSDNKSSHRENSLAVNLTSTPSHSPSIHRVKRPAPPPPTNVKPSRSASVIVSSTAKQSCTRSASSITNRPDTKDTKVEFFYPKDLNPFGEEEETEITASPPPNKKSETPIGTTEEADVDFEYKGRNPFEDFEESPTSDTFSHQDLSQSPSRPSLAPSQSFATKKRRAPDPPQSTLVEGGLPSDTMRSDSVVVHSPTHTGAQRPSDLATLPIRGRDQEERRRSLSLVSSFRKKKKPAPARPVPPKRVVRASRGMSEAEIQASRHRLNTTNKEQHTIEIRSKEIQEALWKADESSGEFEELLAEWLRLVEEKRQLFQEEHDLMMKLEQQELEERHTELEFELRVLSSKQESQKTDTDRQREEELVKLLVETVEARAKLVETEDLDIKRNKPEQNNHNTLETKFKKMLCLKSKFHPKKKNAKSSKETKEKRKKTIC